MEYHNEVFGNGITYIDILVYRERILQYNRDASAGRPRQSKTVTIPRILLNVTYTELP